jgi:hypothetical protein
MFMVKFLESWGGGVKLRGDEYNAMRSTCLSCKFVIVCVVALKGVRSRVPTDGFMAQALSRNLSNQDSVVGNRLYLRALRIAII